LGGEGQRATKVKKTFLVVILCVLSFGGGWVFHYCYPPAGPPLQTKMIRRWALERTLKLRQERLSQVVIVKEEDMVGYSRRLLRFRWQKVPLEAYLLVPKKGKRFAGILAIHGHHTTKEDVVSETQSPFDVNFGVRLVNGGSCVLVPDIPFARDLAKEDQIALNLIMNGNNLMGMRVSYLRTLVDHLSSLSFVDPKRIGCVGWSMGGGLALYLSAVDQRIRVVAISSYFGTYRDTVMRRRQTTDNYIPGILNIGEMADVACLISPRFLWIEGGEQDPEFPTEAFVKGIEGVKNCYRGYERRLKFELFPGGHRFRGEGIEEWFQRCL